jgi:putative flippase GtrA
MSAAGADSLLDPDSRSPALPVSLRRLGGETVRYFLVSAIALGCDLAVYTSLVISGTMATAAGAAGYMIGILLHYALSARWVFPDVEGTRRTAPTFVKFVATGLLGLATTAAIIDALTRHHIAGAFAAKAVAVVTAYLVVFVLRRAYVFAGRARA